jgi:tetratricopeptide (TPR) repeat protein
MKRWTPPALLFAACCLRCSLAASDLAIDPAKIIGESSNFLKKHEPEMSESEQAVYEKVAPILAARPAFALKVLNAMTASSDPNARSSPAFEFMMANAVYVAGDYPLAEAKYKSAVERNPSFIRAWNNLGVLYYVQDRYAEAVPCFSRSVTLGDHDPTTFGLLGNSFEKSGNAVSAEMAYMQALAGDPANINWTEGLLRIYLAEKQHAKAETLVQTLLKNHPREPRYWQTYATLLISCDRKMEAIALMDRMRATGLALTEDLALLADLYVEQRMTSDALATFARLAAVQPLLAEQKLLRFANVLIAEKVWSDAATVLGVLGKTQLSVPGRIACREARVELEIARKNWPVAKEELELIIKEAPSNGNAWIGLGRVYLADTEQAKAAEAFEHAYKLPESSYRASLALANIEFKNRRYVQCLGYLEHALGIQKSTTVENFRDQVKNLIPQEKLSTLSNL